jgi:integrase/recombinase XerD
MARRSKTISLNLEGQKAINSVETFEQALHLFLRDARIRNLSEATLKYYNNELSNVQKMLIRQGVDTRPETITKDIIEEHIILHMMDNGKKETTINATLRAVRSLFNFLYNESFILRNPAKDLQLVKQKRTVVETFNHDQLRLLFRQPDLSTFTGLRDHTIMSLFLETGIRVKELVNIQVNDIKWTDNVIRIAQPKGSKERHVPFQSTMRRELRNYLQVRGQLEHDYLFVNIDNEPMTTRAVQERIKKYGRMAGIKGVRCSPHTFRHTFAKMSVQNGADVFSLQYVLGHTTLDMVRQYVNLYSSEVYEQHRKFSPLEKLM